MAPKQGHSTRDELVLCLGVDVWCASKVHTVRTIGAQKCNKDSDGLHFAALALSSCWRYTE